jgi:ATP synthase F1 gamma subunit
MNLEELKTELQINRELTEIVDALKMIAVSEFRVLEEERKRRFRTFLSAFEGFFHMLDFSAIEHPFARDTSGHLTILMVTSDERFMGGLNKRIVDEALAFPGAGSASLAVIGQQGSDYVKALGRQFYRFPVDISTKHAFAGAVSVRDWVVERAMVEGYGRFAVAYPKPVSFIVQKVEVLPLLPCTELLFLEQREHRRHRAVLGQEEEEVLVDSDMEHLIEYLVSTWIAEKLLEVFEDSRQAELSAKAMRLEESFQGLTDNRKGLVHKYHRTHHEMVDESMRDTFSASVMRRKAS